MGRGPYGHPLDPALGITTPHSISVKDETLKHDRSKHQMAFPQNHNFLISNCHIFCLVWHLSACFVPKFTHNSPISCDINFLSLNLSALTPLSFEDFLIFNTRIADLQEETNGVYDVKIFIRNVNRPGMYNLQVFCLENLSALINFIENKFLSINFIDMRHQFRFLDFIYELRERPSLSPSYQNAPR